MMRSHGIAPANLMLKSPATPWSKTIPDNVLHSRFGMRPAVPLRPDTTLRTGWSMFDAYGQQLRAFRPSRQPLNLRPSVRATAACRSPILQSRRKGSLQSGVTGDQPSDSSKPTVRRLLALLWPDRALLGVALCFLIGAAVSQARQHHGSSV